MKAGEAQATQYIQAQQQAKQAVSVSVLMNLLQCTEAGVFRFTQRHLRPANTMSVHTITWRGRLPIGEGKEARKADGKQIVTEEMVSRLSALVSM